MPTTEDPRKAGEAAHKTVTEVAQAVSDAFYKVDKALLGLPVGAQLAGPLKTIRDTLFATKTQAEQMVQQASQELQTMPPAVEGAEEPIPESKQAAGVPTAAAETIHGFLIKGQSGKAGNLSTDGKVVSLYGNPIFKVENGKIYGSWGNHQPTPTTAANVNGLCLLLGLSTRPFTVSKGRAMANGALVDDLGAWIELGSVTGGAAPKAAAFAHLPPLLQPRNR